MMNARNLVLWAVAGAAALATAACAHQRPVVDQTTTTGAVMIAPPNTPVVTNPDGPNLDRFGDSFETSGGTSGLGARVHRSVPGQALWSTGPVAPAWTPQPVGGAPSPASTTPSTTTSPNDKPLPLAPNPYNAPY